MCDDLMPENDTLVFSQFSDMIAEDPLIIHLSDGTTVYEDKIPNIESTWCRLRKYLKGNDLKITKISLTTNDPPFTVCDVDIDGHVFLKSEIAVFGVGGVRLKGIGYLKDGIKYITWKTPRGPKTEQQKYQEGDPSVILCK